MPGKQRSTGFLRKKLRVHFEHSDKGFAGNLHSAKLAHTLFPFLLFLQQFLFSGDIAAVAFGQNILSHRLYRLPGNDLASDGGLYRNLKLLSRDHVLQLFCDAPSPGIGFIPMNDDRESVT